MARGPNGKQFNPFYQQVDGDVSSELNRRAEFYGSRVRSERVKPGEKGFPEAERLLWSYGKTAYAIITGGGITLGSSHSRVMSDRKGNLSLYDSTRNQPKYPLLQSLELSNEGQLGSLLKGSFTFTVYPDISSAGFKMQDIEKAFLTPGKEVTVKYGWSVRDGGANNGSFTGIISNFDWSVNPDLSITAKTSIVSKATVAIGISGEQTTPDTGEAETDPLGQPIPNGDIAGQIEWDIKNLGGVNNKSVSLGQVGFYAKTGTKSKKLDYYVIGMPMSLVDLDDEVLSKEDQKKKQDFQNTEKFVAEKNNFLNQKIADYSKYDESYKYFSSKLQKEGGDTLVSVKDDAGNAVQRKLSDVVEEAKQKRERAEERIRAEYEQFQTNNNYKAGGSAVDKFIADVKRGAAKQTEAKTQATGSTPPQTVVSTPYSPPKPPPPITHPIYYVKLGDLTEYVNDILKGTPLGDELFEVQCFGNITQHLPDIASASPEEVFFPDEQMGTYGEFAPFSAGGTAGFLKKGANLIDLGNILISTTAIIDTYRAFVKENQTSIEYKNLTGFFDQLIKRINYASGEMYQLTTQLLDPPKGNNSKRRSTLSIEDTHLSKSITSTVTPYGFYATIAKPILKSVSISSKPPGPASAATFVAARPGSSKGVQTDARFTAGSDADPQFLDAKKQIDADKTAFVSKGAGPTFSTGLKGNYAKYKKNSPASNGHWLNKVIYPVDLSLTIDGIDGFKFGDVIKTNLIPERYTAEGMVFVVTKINHSIQNGVWETTINTKSRIEPQ